MSKMSDNGFEPVLKPTRRPDPDADLLFLSAPGGHSLKLSPAVSMLPELYDARVKSRHFDTEEHFLFIFPLSEQIHFRESFLPLPIIGTTEMIFVPSFTRLSVYSPIGTGKYIVLPFIPSIQLCHGICPNNGCRGGKQASNKDDSLSEAAKANKTLSTQLRLHPAAIAWRNTISEYVTQGIKSLFVFEYKLRELFFIFREFYPREEVSSFLSLFHCSNLGFRSFIFRHHWDCRNVEELAELSGLSLTTFKRAFKEEFHTSPLQWMHEQKARYLLRDLEESKATLSELAERYHFSTVSYLCAFCKKMFGDTPNGIRRKSVL